MADLGLIEVVLTIEDLVGADSLNPFPHVQVNFILNIISYEVNVLI